ncbi:hypothetical protein [Ekhidna sp.]|uniref:hypothetical protein n=1 Tax=Ekhidna sp. TaxID=2608089 RepID=UPI003CCC2C38
MGFWIAIILIYILFIIGLTFLAFWLPKRKGRRKLGIFLGILTFLITTFPVTSFLIEDYWFFKSDVTQTLAKHDFHLEDDFEILEHEIIGLRDYYEQFTIEISEKDKQQLIRKIVNAENFEDKTIDQPLDDIYELPRYSNDETEEYTWNSRTTTEYRFHYYKPRPQGLTPVDEYIRIPIDGLTLKYELIYD